MATEITYYCDMCRDRRPPGELHGLFATHKGWVKEVAMKCEHHLCDPCLQTIGVIRDEYNAASIPVETCEGSGERDKVKEDD